MSMKRLPVCNNFNVGVTKVYTGTTGKTCMTIGCHHQEHYHYMTDEELALYGLKRMVIE